MKRVLLVTSGIVHPPFFGRWAFQNALKQLEGFTFNPIGSLEKMPADLLDYSALVIYLHHKTISDPALSALDRFVAGGGGGIGHP